MDDRLQQLVIEIQLAQGPNRAQALANLVEVICRSRPICRHQRGKPLTGIYQVIYEEVKAKLRQELENSIDSYQPQHLSVREWLKEKCDRVWRLDDANLKKLALAAQNLAPQDPSRQYALQELVTAIRYSGLLCRPHRYLFSPQMYALIYEDEVNKILLYACKNIDSYDPERTEKFMTWLNYRLDKNMLGRLSEISKNQQKIVQFTSWDDLDDLLSSAQDIENSQAEQYDRALPEYTDMVLILRQYIEADIDQIFTSKHIRNRPDANLQAIALAIINGQSWKEISLNFGISISTLSSFFQRQCQALAPHIVAEYLKIF